MNEQELRSKIIEARTEKEVAIRENKKILEKLTVLLQKLKDTDQEEIFTLGVDLSNINSLDLNRLSEDSKYLSAMKSELASKINYILQKVEKELG